MSYCESESEENGFAVSARFYSSRYVRCGLCGADIRNNIMFIHYLSFTIYDLRSLNCNLSQL